MMNFVAFLSSFLILCEHVIRTKSFTFVCEFWHRLVPQKYLANFDRNVSRPHVRYLPSAGINVWRLCLRNWKNVIWNPIAVKHSPFKCHFLDDKCKRNLNSDLKKFLLLCIKKCFGAQWLGKFIFSYLPR